MTAADQSSPAGLQAWSRRQALIFGADEVLRCKCATMLQRVAIECREVSDDEAAWTCLLSQRFDLVLMSSTATDPNTIRLLRRMRRAGMTQPAILLREAASATCDAANDISQEFDAVVIRPFTYYELMTAVAGLVAPHSRDPFGRYSSETNHENTKSKIHPH